MRATFSLVACSALVVASLLPACSSSTDEASEPLTGDGAKLHKLPPLGAVKTTAERALIPKHAREDADATGNANPAVFANLPKYEQGGYGERVEAPGEPSVARTLDGTTPPAPGPNAKRLLRFVHLADFQLADDESPTRTGNTDNTDLFSSALRPEEGEMCRMVNATVRTVNALHRADPVSFVLLGGDNADSAQTNEVDWVLSILDGAESVECDSGADDDPVAGPDNDGKDPFYAEGLAMPWKWVTGNHDVLVQGNFKVDAPRSATAVGDTSGLGTRDYAKGGIIENGSFVIPDPKRALLDRAALMAKVSGDHDGHGIGDAQKKSGKAFHTWDVEGTPIRFLVLDTGSETGGSEGMLHQADVDAFVKPVLDDAKAKGKWVVLASHHAVDSLTIDGSTFGTKQPDAILPDAWKTFLGQYDNVLFSMVGHSHRFRVKPQQPPSGGGHAYWEVMTSAIADYPHAFRVVEIWDQDNGYVMMRATAVDLATDGDPVATTGVRRGVIDFTSGWLPGSDRRGDAADRNVDLWIPKPK